MRALAPNGRDILGTLDEMRGRADITPYSWSRDAHGDLNFEWKGHTEVLWDDSKTVRRDHVLSGNPKKERVFIDDEGVEWFECEITLEPSGTEEG